MAIGDLRDITVTGIGKAVPNKFNIYESIFHSYGPAVDLDVVDADDSASNIKGNEDLEIKFTVDGGGQVGFKFKTFTGKNLTDHAGNKENPGSLKNKQYTIRGVSVEALNAQGNYVEEAFTGKTTDTARKVVKDYYKTDKSIEIGDPSKDDKRIRAENKHPKEFLQEVNSMHVSSSNKGSAYCVFQEQSNGTQKYKITSFEDLFKKGSVGKWTQRADLDSSSADENAKRNSIMWFNAGENFNVAADHLKKSAENSFNLSTHSPMDNQTPKKEQFVVLTQPIERQQQAEKVPVGSTISMINQDKRLEGSTGKERRMKFLASLSENSATFEIPGSSDIKLGCIMEIDIPKRTATGGGKERQFSGKVCVVEIRHKIRPPGQVPRYTQVIKAIKAGHG